MPTSHGPLESILAIAEGSFHAAYLAEGDLVHVEAWQTVGDALQCMDTGNIDVTPPREDATRRHVVREEPRQGDDLVKVFDVARAVDISHLLTGDAGLGEALELLEDRGYLFTIEGDRMRGSSRRQTCSGPLSASWSSR
jgi:hypothetical protein